MKKYLKEFVQFGLILFAVSYGVSFFRSSSLNKSDFQFHSIKLIDGELFKPHPSKPLLVHVWATWCPTCKFEAGNIEKISKEFEVLTIAVNSGGNAEIQNFLKERNLTFRTVNDSLGSLSKHLNVQAFPTTFIYNGEKELVFTEVGYTTTAGLWARMELAE